MRFFRYFFLVFGFFAFALHPSFLGSETAGQQHGDVPAARPLPVADEVSTPFDLHAPASQRVNSIEFLPQDAIAPEDRQFIHEAGPAIEKQAAQAGFDLGQAKWKYRQIMCPALPEHMLLLFAQANGAGDRSMFSAAVSRDEKEPVRILPILRRGYAPYSPAPVNLLSIAVFNQIRAHDHDRKKPDWLTTGLCYAAISGVHVALAVPLRGGESDTYPLVMHPLIQVDSDGITEIRFMDAETPQQPKQWNLIFDQQGKLMKVTIDELTAPTIRLIP